ncbi:MAG: 3'-5' exonuclease [Muribaculaceae bacterium]|nr:3'-5' exonuclease [Muribaculaceae bacterium]
MNIYCLDAEFTENEELLELSIFNLKGEEVYHSYYRPIYNKEWRTDIHHITPEMVENEPAFEDKREEVESLLNGADALTGFAVGNDIRVLTRSGVMGLENQKILDVKDMYWYLRGRKTDMNPFSIPSLLVCANSLGLDFAEEEAHSASADTEATLRCFNFLWEEFKKEEGFEGRDEECLELFHQRIKEEKDKFIEESAHGYVKVLKNGPFYKVKFGKFRETEDKGLILEVEVADRYKAEYEVRKSLKKKTVPGKIGIYKLGPKQLEELRKYKNVYDAEESAWCKKVMRGIGKVGDWVIGRLGNWVIG